MPLRLTWTVLAAPFVITCIAMLAHVPSGSLPVLVARVAFANVRPIAPVAFWR